MIFDKTGSLATTTRHDYLPFGEELWANQGLRTTTQGMFTSPDTLLGSIANPQSLNRYSYVGNNPLSFSDPTGHLPSSSPSYSPTFNEGEGGWSQDDPNNPNTVLASLGGLPDCYE